MVGEHIAVGPAALNGLVIDVIHWDHGAPGIDRDSLVTPELGAIVVVAVAGHSGVG